MRFNRVLQKVTAKLRIALGTWESPSEESIWDDSAGQYVQNNFKVYWETLPAVARYQLRLITGDPEILCFFRYITMLVEQHLGTGLRALAIGALDGPDPPEMALTTTGLLAEVDVMDVAQGLLLKQSSLAKQRGFSNIHYHRQDMNIVELPMNHYDLVWAIGTVHHIDKLEHLFEQVKRSLKPKGLFLLREYIGPNRIQFSDAQLAICNALLMLLPDKFKTTSTGRLKTQVNRHCIKRIMRFDPSESVRSADIIKTFLDSFPNAEIRYTGGSILHPLLQDIANNFEGDPEGEAVLDLLITLDEMQVKNNTMPSDYVFCMAEKI
jgi:SAM-dependent methyltransferase